MAVLIDAAELAVRLGVRVGERRAAEPRGIVVIDVTWEATRPDGFRRYLAGHIPGAVYADLAADLAGPASELDGRMPLPAASALTERLRSWGVSSRDSIVVIDDDANRSAARAWWLLRHAGLGDVRLLDGGLGAWRAAGLPLESGSPRPSRGNATATYGGMPTVGMAEAARLPVDGVLLDAREAPRYRGEHEPLDSRPGHIPGARSAPTADNVDENGRFRSPTELRARFAALGVTDDTPVGVYCGSGIAGAHEVAALAIAGIEASLYPGSWSQWSRHAQLPVATGEDAGGPMTSPPARS